MKISKKTAIENDLPFTCDEQWIVRQRRWDTLWEGVVQIDGKHFKLDWWAGSTEMQETGPFEDEDEIELTEVKKQQVTLERWVAV